MPQRATTLHLAQSCQESWAAMTPTGAGRHCAACQKTVVDFTQKTDAEILAHLARAAGGTCGRLHAGQLGRPLQLPAPASRWRALLGALLTAGSLGQGLAPEAVAQAVPAAYRSNPAANDPWPPSARVPAAPPMPGPWVLRGVVRAADTHKPLAHVAVVLNNLDHSFVLTDVAGTFEFKVLGGANSVQLFINALGYAGREVTLPARDGQPLYIDLLAGSQGMALGVLVASETSVATSRALPRSWRPRAIYRWSAYWLTWPFRH